MLLTAVICLVAVTQQCSADIFTAIADMQNLLGAENEVKTMISNYIDVEMQRLERLKKIADEYSARNAEAAKNGPEFVMNPINAFKLVKRLTHDWDLVETAMTKNSADFFLKNITATRVSRKAKYPQQEDLTGAAIGLVRLQDTYKLDTQQLASGYINGKRIGRELSSQDCFEIGKATYDSGDYYHTVLWMLEAQRRHANDKTESVEMTDIIEYLAFALFKQNNIKRALAYTKQLLQLNPDHPRARGNIKWYEDMLSMEERETEEIPPLRLQRPDDLPERDAYEALCRGEETAPVDHSVYCYYKMDKPYLRLAPIKVEILRFDPLVVLFKQIITDYEIEVIKELSIPRLRRATVQNARTGELEYANYRISKSAWIKGEEHPVIDRINKRIAMMTNLNQDTSEELQAQNYGIGGHYDPHFDFARAANYGIGGHYEPHFDMSTRGEKDPYRIGMGNRIATVLIYKEETNAFKTLGTGNRIATILIYMTDVEMGGATVFSELGNAVFPSKYDALYWYNLRRNGEGDLRTRHAACPVLLGIKWVANKWIHERGQEFTRPCGLSENAAEEYIGDLRG